MGSGKKRDTAFGVRAGRRDNQATAKQWCQALRSAGQIWCQAVRFGAEKRGARHCGNQKKWCQALPLARKAWCQALRFFRRGREPIPPQLRIMPLDNIGTSRARVRPDSHYTAQKSLNEKPKKPSTGSYKPPPTRLSPHNPLRAAKKASEKPNFHPSRDTNSSPTDSRPSLPAPRAAYATLPAAASPNR
ncbi:MAG: hypothetical protein KatS3mg110_4479 [Pirellulaceae bacterium]|nr:MAG: hypothetical protein KatS3mg110_4479 [Pirellulaceae bacterium]